MVADVGAEAGREGAVEDTVGVAAAWAAGKAMKSGRRCKNCCDHPQPSRFP
jgi:hypothetical protein